MINISMKIRDLINIVESAQRTPAQVFVKHCEDMGMLYVAGGTLHIRPFGAATVMIENIAVEDEYRGQGVANELMRDIMSEASKNGIGLILEVASRNDGGLDNEGLYEWYSRLGFEPDSDGSLSAAMGVPATMMHYNFNEYSLLWGEDEDEDDDENP